MTKRTCGLIMPISAIDECNNEHWEDVKKILEEALSDKFIVRLVSECNDSNVIQGTII